eukprot:11274584-Heterocapsa_arctica.AAC.1
MEDTRNMVEEMVGRASGMVSVEILFTLTEVRALVVFRSSDVGAHRRLSLREGALEYLVR